MKGKLDDLETQDLPAGVGIVDIKAPQSARPGRGAVTWSCPHAHEILP